MQLSTHWEDLMLKKPNTSFSGNQPSGNIEHDSYFETSKGGHSVVDDARCESEDET
jgi:hypothetical protein